MPLYRTAKIRSILGCALVLIALAPLAIIWHEIMGHGLFGVLCGGKVARLQILWFQFWPEIQWGDLGEGLGICNVVGLRSSSCVGLTTLGGVAGTLLASAVAATALRRCQPRGWSRAVLIAVALWSLDLLTFTLPSFGLKRYVLFGTTYSEPCDGAVTMGVPILLFQVLSVAVSLAVLIVAFAPNRHGRRAILTEELAHGTQ